MARESNTLLAVRSLRATVICVQVHRRSFQPIRGICKWTRPKANQAAPEEAAQGAGEAGVGAQLLEAA